MLSRWTGDSRKESRKAGDSWTLQLVSMTRHQIGLWVQKPSGAQVESWGWGSNSEYSSEHGCLGNDAVYQQSVAWFLQYPHSEPLRWLVYKHDCGILQFWCEYSGKFLSQLQLLCMLVTHLNIVLAAWCSVLLCSQVQVSFTVLSMSDKRKSLILLINVRLHHCGNCDSTRRKLHLRCLPNNLQLEGKNIDKHLKCLMPLHPPSMTHCLQLLPLLISKNWIYPRFKSQLPLGWVVKKACHWVCCLHHVVHFSQTAALQHEKVEPVSSTVDVNFPGITWSYNSSHSLGFTRYSTSSVKCLTS